MIRPYLIVVLALMGAAPASLAEDLPPPLELSPSAASPASNPGFATDVENALDDLTRFQCGLLGLVMINSQPCPVP